MPREYFDRQIALTNASGVSDYTFRRTTYQGMIKFMDDVVSNLTLALKEKNMYNVRSLPTSILYSCPLLRLDT